jgi:hypothetical protein
MGRFYGRIWIEDQDGNVVRFNGTYTGPQREDSSKYYFHFDSWRMNVQPGESGCRWPSTWKRRRASRATNPSA